MTFLCLPVVLLTSVSLASTSRVVFTTSLTVMIALIATGSPCPVCLSELMLVNMEADESPVPLSPEPEPATDAADDGLSLCLICRDLLYGGQQYYCLHCCIALHTLVRS